MVSFTLIIFVVVVVLSLLFHRLESVVIRARIKDLRCQIVLLSAVCVDFCRTLVDDFVFGICELIEGHGALVKFMKFIIDQAGFKILMLFRGAISSTSLLNGLTFGCLSEPVVRVLPVSCGSCETGVPFFATWMFDCCLSVEFVSLSLLRCLLLQNRNPVLAF